MLFLIYATKEIRANGVRSLWVGALAKRLSVLIRFWIVTAILFFCPFVQAGVHKSRVNLKPGESHIYRVTNAAGKIVSGKIICLSFYQLLKGGVTCGEATECSLLRSGSSVKVAGARVTCDVP